MVPLKFITLSSLFQSLGNHEFDNGISGLTPFIKNLTCPVLAANLVLTEEPSLEAENNLMKSVVFNINGAQVGVIGYLTPDTKNLAIGNNVKYIEEVTAIKDEVKRLKSEGVNIFIALGHSGFTKDLEIAKEVDGIDLVIGGHTNTFLWNGTTPDSETPQGPYPTLVKQSSGRMVPVVQAYAYTKYLGKLYLVFNANGEIVSIDGNPILLNNSVPQDPSVLSIIDKYRESVMQISDVIVGNTSVVLDGNSCRLNECNLGNLITDAIVHKYASDYRGNSWTDAPIAIAQGGGIRASIAHSDQSYNITKGDLLTVMPFDGNIAKVTVTGTNVWKMLEHSVADYNVIRSPGQFLQISGLRVEYNFKRRAGQRVVKVQVLCGNCSIPVYLPLNKTATYNILMNRFLSVGGDGFTVFKSLPSVDLDFSELTATIKYINMNSPVYPAIEGRIIIHNLNVMNSATSKSALSFLLLLTFSCRSFFSANYI